jgi:hypothetical protein
LSVIFGAWALKCRTWGFSFCFFFFFQKEKEERAYELAAALACDGCRLTVDARPPDTSS